MPIATALALLLAASAASAQPMPQPKVAQCRAGYRGYCAPMNDKAPAACRNADSAHQGSCNQATTASIRAGTDASRGALLFGRRRRPCHLDNGRIRTQPELRGRWGEGREPIEQR
jgi:hypothetical protein